MTVAQFLDWNGDGTDTRLIGNHLAERMPGCHVVTAPGVQPRVRSSRNLRIPDLGVTCAADEGGLRTLPDPILLVEILSPGNEAETWENVWTYTTLPSVREILMLRTAGAGAELLRRQTD